MSKEKGKEHPFAGRMDSNEEILWMMVTPPLRVWDSFKTWIVFGCLGFVVTSVGPFFAVILGLVLSLLMNNAPPLKSEQIATPITVTVTPTAILGMIFIVICFVAIAILLNAALRIPYFVWVSRQPFHNAYAVTNKRLLRRCLNDFSSIPLDRITDLQLSPKEDSLGTLSFGTPFRSWRRIDNAEHVKQIIEEAQKEWLKVIRA